MSKTATRSSTMARAVRNTFKESGTRLPSRAIIPRAKAMSVATGIPPPSYALASPVDRCIDHAWGYDAAHGSDHRQDGVTRLGELSHGDLALDLEAHQKEEERHKTVVHP